MNFKSELEQRPVREWMRAIHRLQPYKRSRAMWLAAASAVILSGVMVLGAIAPSTHTLEPGFHTVLVAVANLLLFTVLYSYNFWIIRCGVQGGRLAAAGLVGSLLLSTAVAVLQWLAERLFYGASFNTLIMTLIIDASAALIAYLIALLLYNVTLHQQAVVENEHLQAENMRIRFETLEQQVSPHFLFNSLNTLDGLIGVDNAGAHRYLHSLSDTFRYTLGSRETVTLSEELEFTRNYVAMMQMRYGSDALHVDVHVDPALMELKLPPISLQLLVENAVKHNVATQRRPLTVRIASCEGPAIVVTNSKQPKEEHDESSGVGLANLSGRYSLLFHCDIEITDSETEFKVVLPLI